MTREKSTHVHPILPSEHKHGGSNQFSNALIPMALFFPPILDNAIQKKNIDTIKIDRIANFSQWSIWIVKRIFWDYGHCNSARFSFVRNTSTQRSTSWVNDGNPRNICRQKLWKYEPGDKLRNMRGIFKRGMQKMSSWGEEEKIPQVRSIKSNTGFRG